MIDFHTHSSMSDGSLNPEDLVSRAKSHGVEYLALTDHDTIDGLSRASIAAKKNDLHLITGIELSSEWSGIGVHIVGLGFDVNSPILLGGIKRQKQARLHRAQTIAERLAKKGFLNTFEGARAIAMKQSGCEARGECSDMLESENLIIARPHFAQYLVQAGYVKSEKAAFKRYLGAGKIGDIKSCWPEMQTVIAWIKASGGVSVLAHPLHYKLTNSKLRRLMTDFKAVGGEAVEVISGRQTSEQTDYVAKLADEFGLFASAGSDFHSPDFAWQGLGKIGKLPSLCRPVPVYPTV
ncbi:MAG: PHP domain-containing protein [Cellvibrionaceae bacterium]